MKKLLDFGCETVIITLGSEGAVYLSKNSQQPVHVLCEQVVPVDTTVIFFSSVNNYFISFKLNFMLIHVLQGAGDAFVGALATYLVLHKEQPIHQIVGAACRVATLSVTKEGTQTSYPNKFNAFEKEYKYINL